MSEEEAKEEELKPLEIIDKTPKEKEKNPTSTDELDDYLDNYTPSDEEMKEMTNAQ